MPVVQLSPQPLTIADIIADAFIEIGVIAAGETLSGLDAAFGLRKVRRMLDAWNANEFYIYSKVFQQYTIPTGTAINLDGSVDFEIGIAANSPDFVMPAGSGTRPQRIASASIILNNVNPAVKSQLEIRDRRWWPTQLVPGVSTQVPSDLYYEPAWPNGLIFLWPVETISYLLELELESQLTSFVNFTDQFTLPPAYEKAIVLSLAEDLAPSYGSPINVAAEAARARDEAKSPNMGAPTMNLAAAVPTGSKGLPSFNFRTGTSR